jgi:ferredoxin
LIPFDIFAKLFRNTMQTQELKNVALGFGADLVGVAPIAPIARLAELPAKNNPLTIAPNARSVVVLGKRILRGSLRGVEEGTNFHSTYTVFGMQWLEGEFLSRTIQHTAEFLEDAGFEALPLLGLRQDNGDFEPDPIAFARAAGLGDVGKNGLFLTPEFGPRQRFGFVVTNAELEPDPVRKINFCDGCDACVKACPLRDEKLLFPPLSRCRVCKNGAVPTGGKVESVDRFAAACGRACVVATENKLTKKFTTPFRRREPWSIA